jgi:hypothetical protein
MKHFLLTISALLAALSILPAQITLSGDRFPAAGDTLIEAVDNMPSGIELGTPGPGRSWNFTTLQAPFSDEVLLLPAEQLEGSFAFPTADFGVELTGANNFYQLTDETVELLGYFGEAPVDLGIEGVFRQNPPLIDQHATVNYNDSFSSESDIALAVSTENLPGGIFDQLPVSPDSIRLRINLQRTDEIDAWGTLTLPGAIYDVLREKRTDVRDFRVEVRVGFFPWTDVTDILIDQLGIEGVGAVTTVSYRFLSQEAPEPVAEVFVDESGVPIRVTYKVNEDLTNLRQLERREPSVYAYPNPTIVNVRFEFTDLPKDAYTLRIFNILGVEEWSRRFEIAGHHVEKLNVSFLTKGTYLYSLSDSKGKTLVTRRLVIVRP